ncbi:MAG: signal recognition particle-docking protein FtsY [Rubrivivax sp.]
MFSFFKKKAPPPAAPAHAQPQPQPQPQPTLDPGSPPATPEPSPAGGAIPAPAPASLLGRFFSPAPAPAPAPASVSVSTTAPPPPPLLAPAPGPAPAPSLAPAPVFVAPATAATPSRSAWVARLQQGLRRSGAGIASVFTGARIDDALYDDLESALLMADTGVAATQWLMDALRRSARFGGITDPAAIKPQLVASLANLLRPLQAELTIGETTPTVIMVVGVNGAGKTTSIGKLTRHLAASGCKVLLAAADTFRAAAREQLGVWADRNQVEVIAQEGGDAAAVSFDAVTAGRARGCDVVIADTAGRLPTQLHLMDELKKIHRTIGKAMPGAPHEVLLVVDGNTGQNALAQLKAFDAALKVTGLIVTKLDGTAKGGVLAAIARWGADQGRVMPVYFIGLGEKLEDLQRFDADEFARALVG